MSFAINSIRQNPSRAVLIASVTGGCALLLSWYFRRKPRHSGGRDSAISFSNTEVALSSLNEVLGRLEVLLKELDGSKFKSEKDRDKYDFMSSIINRIKGVLGDLDNFRRGDIQVTSTTDEIARTIWNSNDPSSIKPGTLSVLSDDSFVSAIDDFVPQSGEASLSLSIDYENIKFYHEGVKAFENGQVTYRKSRAEICNCESEADFAAKLWCLRQAFDVIFAETKKRAWIIRVGRTVIADILRHFKKDPKDFYEAFDRMVSYLQTPTNIDQVVEELKQRKVECLNLWDVLFDFILLDSFDDLRKPPSGTAALVKNSFLSQSMRESTLNNLIWSLIKMKRSRLQIQDGFVSRFYDISQIVSPPLIMGLLGGANKEFEVLCQDFKENIFILIRDLFNPATLRYNSLEELSDDVSKVLESRLETIQLNLSNELLPI